MYRTITLSVCAVMLVVMASGPGRADEGLQVGVAEADITPPEGFPMAGYYHERLATGMIDPLKAKALVFCDGDCKAAWVACDLIGITRDLCLEVRRQASAKTGIPEKNIAISATHSHTAPDYTCHLYDYLEKETPADAPAPYAAKLIGGLVEAVVKANAGLLPAMVKTGSTQQETPVAFNRRFVMKDGSVRTWQSLSNPQVVRSAGPIDPEIGLALIQTADGNKPAALISNFALHLDTVGGTLWSADYPSFIEQAVRKELGEGVISVFGNGACGDINHCDPSKKERNKTDFIGNSLAGTICAALTKLEAADKPALDVRSTTVNLALQEVTDKDLDRALELIPLAIKGEKTDFYELVKACNAVAIDQYRNGPSKGELKHCNRRLSHNWAGVGESLPVDVMTITLGDDLALVFMPGEIFVDLGLAVKQASPYKTTMVVELCNCVETIYVPTRAAFAGGSYEVTNSCVQPGSGEMLVEAALRLLRESASSN